MRSALRLAWPLLLTTLLLFAGAAHAEPTGPKAPPAARPAGDDRVVHVCEIRYQDVHSVSLVLPSLMSDAGILTVDRATRTVTIVDHPEFVQRVKDFVAQFDVPPQAVLIRIVLEKAQRQGAAAARGLSAAATGTDQLASDSTGWTYSPLAETTLEVLERGQATQAAHDKHLHG